MKKLMGARVRDLFFKTVVVSGKLFIAGSLGAMEYREAKKTAEDRLHDECSPEEIPCWIEPTREDFASAKKSHWF